MGSCRTASRPPTALVSAFTFAVCRERGCTPRAAVTAAARRAVWKAAAVSDASRDPDEDGPVGSRRDERAWADRELRDLLRGLLFESNLSYDRLVEAAAV